MHTSCAFFKKFSAKIIKFIIVFINFAGVKISVFEIIEYIFFLIDANMLYVTGESGLKMLECLFL